MKISVVGVSLVASAAVSTGAGAQETTAAVAEQAERAPGSGVNEIIVTAQKREQNLQSVPLAITAMGEEMLEARGIENVTDLGTSISGLTFQSYNANVQPYLRGIGAFGAAAGIEPSVGVYVDNVYFSRLPKSFLDLNNVSRVEVLKGPQGTLFGRNSTGGIINVITKDPSYELQAKGSVGYGNLEAFDADAYISTGLSQTVAVDLSVAGHTDQGAGTNLTTGNRFVYEDSVIARSKLLFEPNDLTRVTLSGFYSWSENSNNKTPFPGLTAIQFTPPNTAYSSDQIGFYDSLDNRDTRNVYEVYGGYVRVDQELDFASMVSISGYSNLHENFYGDGDYLPAPDFNFFLESSTKLFTQELQLVSPAGSPFDWIVGAYYYNNVTAYDQINFFGNIFPQPLLLTGRQKATSFAVFGQASYEVVPNLTFTGGFRYTWDNLDGSGVAGPPGKDHRDKPSYRATLDYQATPAILFYATYAHGYKSGNFTLLPYTSPEASRPEELDAYEAGFKADLFRSHLRLNGSGFYYDVQNPQVQLVDGVAVIASNANSSRVYGAELEMDARLADSINLRGGVTYLDSKYIDYGNIVNGQCIGCAPSAVIVPTGIVSIPGGVVADGNRTPLAAKWTFNVGADYELPLGEQMLTFTLDYYYNDGYFFEPSELVAQDSYGLLSGQVKLDLNQNLAVRVWGKNLTDEQYLAGAQIQTVGPGSIPYNPALPRTYGVAVKFDF